jgi:hypothetical protein
LESSYKAVCEFWHGKHGAIDRQNQEILINKEGIKEMINDGILKDRDGDQFFILKAKINYL